MEVYTCTIVSGGEFEDLESVKFEMLDDSEDLVLGAKAKAAVEQLRQQEAST